MEAALLQGETLKVRSVWISDVHLGFRGCSADYLLHFLQHVECDYLYLVGDIIDIWEMKKRLYWPQEHNNVIRTLLGKAKHNTKVIYVPGNHDEMLRDFNGVVFGNIEIRNETIHTTADGKKLLILHGDQFDGVVQFSPFLAKLGSRLYDYLLRANRWVNYVRRKMGFPYWSLAAFLKHKVKNAVKYIGDFEKAVAHEAAKQGVDGIVCGHIHRAEISRIEGVDYFNCGDWVESCTALVEQQDGSMEILKWADLHQAPNVQLAQVS
ncbi:MAG: UDP-2,3-diacylglucosamine hydrolase [Gammaproteobacteria bacterium]|nr:MAG: UDP-2,3-diacylglucosamine hydrolase [Gammaproteobacteria bacterium]